MENKVNVDINRASSLLSEDEVLKKIEIKEDLEESAKNETEEIIPSEFIPIKLPSNGKIEGIPKILHFRDYSAKNSLDINTPNDEDKPKAIAEVLSQMCYENFNIKTLPVNDVLYILYVLQATFISNTITKEIYIDENLPEGEDKGELDNPNNIEEVDIKISKLNMIYLGLDEDDNELEPKIKVPFTIRDNVTGNKVKIKFATLEDSILANNYCKDFYADEFMKHSAIRKAISDIQAISNNEKRKIAMNNLMSEQFDACEKYYNFMRNYSYTLAQVIQSLQIVSYNDVECTTMSEKWNVYCNKISANIWKMYNDIVEKYKFGLNEKVKVYSNKLKKEVVRNIGFQLSDFISIDKPKETDRYSVLFD